MWHTSTDTKASFDDEAAETPIVPTPITGRTLPWASGVDGEPEFGIMGGVTPTRPLRVLAVGPAPSGPDSRGGMATVLSQMITIDPALAEFLVVPTYNDTPAISRWWLGIRGMIRAAALILAGRVDVAHVHLAHGGSVLRKSLPLWVARLRGVPTVIHAHSYNFADWYRTLPPAVAVVVRLMLPADRWLILGRDLADEYRETLTLDPNIVQVLHNPAPEVTGEESSDSSLGDPVVAVALGRLGERKGTFDIIEAVGRLDEAVRSRLVVVLAGDDQVEQARAAAARVNGALGTRGPVQVRDWLNPDQRDALLAAGDVFLLPSYDEGLPMALLEAMAAGLAPITSPVGAIGDVINDGHNGILVRPGDIDAIAAGIERLVTDEPYRRELSTHARETVRTFSLASWHSELLAVWRSLVD